MKFIITVLFLSILPHTVLAQDYAAFRTDTSRFSGQFQENEGKLPPYITEQVWYINGQEMRYDTLTVKVAVNPNKLDTILYKGYRRNEFDTIICNISEARNFTFFYNDCCGAFNIQDDSTGKFIQGKIIYQLAHADDHTYLGTLGETGILVSENKTDTLHVNCRSAMSPNIYPISFQQINICRDSLGCEAGTCLQSDTELDWEFGFDIISKKMDFLYMPLSSKPLIITYDPKTDQVVIE